MVTQQQALTHLLRAQFGNATFTLPQVYDVAVPVLAKLYPCNKHLQATVRHTLNTLRKANAVKFVDFAGTYCLAR